MKFSKDNKDFIITTVYARCSSLERLELWGEMEYIANNNNLPRIVGGDLNDILAEEEKQVGLSFTQSEATDFSLCINNCTLNEVSFFGRKYTWWKGRIEEECIFKRLNRVMVNQDFIDIFPSTEVHYLIRQGSDHTPLHLVCNTEEEPNINLLDF